MISISDGKCRVDALCHSNIQPVADNWSCRGSRSSPALPQSPPNLLPPGRLLVAGACGRRARCSAAATEAAATACRRPCTAQQRIQFAQGPAWCRAFRQLDRPSHRSSGTLSRPCRRRPPAPAPAGRRPRGHTATSTWLQFITPCWRWLCWRPVPPWPLLTATPGSVPPAAWTPAAPPSPSAAYTRRSWCLP